MMFRIIEIPQEEIGSCIVSAFQYMVESVEDGTRWFGSNNYQDCLDYIQKYTTNN